MTYQDTLAWLYGLEAKRGMDFRLERLGPVLERLGNPQAAFPAVHVAGTNGKGSTAAMLHSIYSCAGYRTGLYTSPHLLSFRERVRVGAETIAEESVVRWTRAVREAMDAAAVDLTFFEITTLVAFLEFRARNVDLAVVEVGLGGRLDATNVVDTVAAVITSIAFDHEHFLGDTLAKIAFEKAGILRRNVPLITGDLPDEALEVVAERVAATGSRWLCFGQDFGPSRLVGYDTAGHGLLGQHQQRNAAIAAATVRALADAFPVSDDAITGGIVRARWPGRLEIFAGRPRIVVDAAHNPEAAACLRDALAALDFPRPRVLVFGVMADKAWGEMLSSLVPACDRVVLVPVQNTRSLDPALARPLVEGLRPCEVAASAARGLQAAKARAGAGGTVIVAGSIFLVAELYRLCGGAEDPFVDAS
jgi:dihydrofolate synthase/folylpolyglutamate synthase